MKKILTVFLIVISTVCQSQIYSIPTTPMGSNSDILKNDTLKFLANTLKLNVNEYKVLPLRNLTDSSLYYDKRGIKYKIINSTITFKELSCNSIIQKVLKYNTHSNNRMGEKLLYCDITNLPDENKNYYVLFYVLE